MNNYPFEGLKSLPLQLGDCFGRKVRSWRALALTEIIVFVGFLAPVQSVHAQGGMCTMCEIGRGLPGQCTPEFMASCRGTKGTGETGGSNVPRDSKTKAPPAKAPRDECENAESQLQNLYQRYNELETRLRQLGEMYMQENTMISPEGASIMEAMAGIRRQIANLRAKCHLAGVPPGTTPGGPPPLPPTPPGGGSGGGGGGGGGGGPGGGFGGGRGGRQAFLVPTRDIQESLKDDGGKGIGKWLPWTRGKQESSQPGPGAIGPGSRREDIAPLPRERLPEVLAALEEFRSASPGNVNLPALNSIVESARRESEPSRQTEILKTVLPMLLAGLQDRAAPVRRGAANALGKIGQGAAPAIPPLVEKLQDPDETVRKTAAGALKEIANQIAKTPPRENDPKRQAEIQKTIAAVQHGDAATRRQSAEKLGTMGRQAGPAIPALVDRMQDSDAAVRSVAADALKKIARSFETQNNSGSERRRAALCMDMSWTRFQISTSACDLAAR